RQDIFLLAVWRLRVLTAILGEARHLRTGWRRQIKRVRRDQVQCHPRRDFARKRRSQTSIGIWDRVAVLIRYKFALRSRRLPLDGEASCLESRQIDIVIFVLAGDVKRGATIETSQPGVSRPVVERADKGSIMWQRACKREAEHKFTRKTNSLANRGRLKLKPREIGAVEGKGKPAKIATTKDGGIQNIDCFVINPFHHSAGKV